MNLEQFGFWLKGYFELNGVESLTKEQAQIIKEHLDLAFTKVTETTLSEQMNLEEHIQRIRDASNQRDTRECAKPPFTVTCDTTGGALIC